MTLRRKKHVRVKARKPLRGRSWNLPETFVPDANLPPTSDLAGVVFVPEKETLLKSMLVEKKTVRAEIERKLLSSAPVCNKGAYMYIGASDDLTAIGRKK
jgi:hypothetical protein